MNSSEIDLNYILSSKAVREKANEVYQRTIDGKGLFRWNEEKLSETTQFVLETIKENYPTFDIPFHSRWGHFNAEGINRVKAFENKISHDQKEHCRAKLDLVVTSVLLDAGAGKDWSYHESSSGKKISRSEGLAVASLDLFESGAFSSDENHFQADAKGLQSFSASMLTKGFQVDDNNPLVGVEGRVELLNALGRALESQPTHFKDQRVGNLYDYVTQHFGQSLEASELLSVVLKLFGSIWPSRITIDGVNLGDVWEHSELGLIPFHKLSQWLTYSLMEPLMEAGIEIKNLDSMTGLPEYRNGGLILDMGLVELKDASLLAKPHAPESDVIIEWRALTVKSLDLIGEKLRELLGKSSAELPLVKVLEGGTWHAGRKIAKQKRQGGEPPLNIQSDGTVF